MKTDPKKRYDEDQLIIDDPAISTEEREAARIRQGFWRARYREIKKSEEFADLFVGMWYDMLLYMMGSHMFGFKRQLQKNLDQFFNEAKLQSAMQAAGPQADLLLEAELTDSARVYYDACRTDKNYGSILFNMIKSKDEDIAAKAAKETARYFLLPLTQIDRPQWSRMMIRSAWTAYQQVFTASAAVLEKQIDQLDPEAVRQIRQSLQS